MLIPHLLLISIIITYFNNYTISLLPSENIHINSFMFKLGIDISIKYIVDLFRQVSFLV